jgi:hypothetical protein
MIKWQNTLKWIEEAKTIEIPRAYSSKIEKSDKLQLFVFTDAGTEAQCNVAYLRIMSKSNEQKDVNIVAGKNYIVPCKQKRTIPELEFDALVKGITFTENIIDDHDLKFDEIYMLTDSSIVFQWIMNGIENPSIYQKNRMTKLSQTKLKINFRWVNTDLQTADYGTKFSSMPKMDSDNEWFKPPIFRLPEGSWPKSPPSQLTEEKFLNISARNMLFRGKGEFIDTTLFSTLNKVIMVVRKYIIGWKFAAKRKSLIKKKKNLDDALTQNSISARTHRYEMKVLQEKMENNEKISNDWTHKRQIILETLIKHDQEKFFREEMQLIKNQKSLPVKHYLHKQMLVLHNDILCVSTRLPQHNDHISDKDYFSAHPILMHKDSHLTQLIILHHHVQNRHLNFDTICTSLMRNYFIPHLRCTARRIIKSQCYFCKLQSPHIRAPIMGDLPVERLCDVHAPFSHIIVDTCGPFMIRQRDIRSAKDPPKRWLLFVTCLSTRAVHIEILYHMTADSAIKALLNTFEIRGFALSIISDAATNFIGSNNEWKRALDEHNKDRIQKGFEPINLDTLWTFNPAHAHHMSGSVERMIGCAKKAFKNITKMLNAKMEKLDDESFRTLICSVMGILNNRPLCLSPLTNTVDKFLTPNYFLMGRANNFYTPHSEISHQYNHMWEDVLRLKDTLWAHWLKEYVPLCLKREKWVKKRDNLAVGDIVLTVENSKANSWKLGKIIDILEGSHDQVRKVRVLIGKKNPVNKPVEKFKNFKNDRELRRLIMKEYHIGDTWCVTRAASHCVPLDLSVVDDDSHSLDL